MKGGIAVLVQRRPGGGADPEAGEGRVLRRVAERRDIARKGHRSHQGERLRAIGCPRMGRDLPVGARAVAGVIAAVLPARVARKAAALPVAGRIEPGAVACPDPVLSVLAAAQASTIGMLRNRQAARHRIAAARGLGACGHRARTVLRGCGLIPVKAGTGPGARVAGKHGPWRIRNVSHTPHELHEEFPDKAARIHELKGADPHFARLMDEYHEINRAVHRAETGVEPTDDLHETELRKKRAHLKDELYRMLAG